ncbi:MAG: hypothetical protein QOA70_06840 [Nitrososphaeraceae archaeon]|nr:hypothetical protein [Nitrososphaeraceae archaeon]
MKILVKVTRDVLERSKMCGIDKDEWIMIPYNCAVSLAIIELFPSACTETLYCYLLGENDSSTNNENSMDAVVLPSYVSDFIVEFDGLTPDERVLMSPFSFEIEVPEYVIQKIGIGQIYKVLSESSTLEHVNK